MKLLHPVALCLMLAVFGAPRAAAAAKIACVGDSITFGYGLGDPATQSYPPLLGELLGAEHTVENFGVSGATLLKSGDRPYWDEMRFAESDAFDPDVVVVMLGTNDAKPQNWAHEADFAADYSALIAHYEALGAFVYVATPPPVVAPGAFEISPEVANGEVVPRVRAIASAESAPLIDVFEALADDAADFPDTVHPNAAGAARIAAAVLSALQDNDFGQAVSTGSGGADNAGGSAGLGPVGDGGGTALGGSAGAGGVQNSADVANSGGAQPSEPTGTSAGSSSSPDATGAPSASSSSAPSSSAPSSSAATANATASSSTAPIAMNTASPIVDPPPTTSSSAATDPKPSTSSTPVAPASAAPGTATSKPSAATEAPEDTTDSDGGCTVQTDQRPTRGAPWVALGLLVLSIHQRRTHPRTARQQLDTSR